MGEKYLGQLTAKSAPATGDILVLEDSEDTKKIDYDALANAILNKLTTKTYTVAGGTNTLIAAIDALNSNLPYVSTGTIASAIASKVTAGVNHGFFLAKNDLADAPSVAFYKIEYIRVAGTNNVYVKAYANHATDNTYEAMFDYTNVTSLSGLWTKFPTRAEMDALNSKSYSGLEVRRDTQNVTTFTFSNLPDINAARYKHFIVVYGDASNATTLAVYHGAINTTGGVVLNAIEKGSGAVTITASVTDNALKITGTSAIYGGVRLIWLS